MMLPPLDTPVLEPHFHLCLGQPECVRQVQPLRPDHVLLSGKFSLQPLQLLRREDRTHPLQLAAAAAAAAAGTRARTAVFRPAFLTYDPDQFTTSQSTTSLRISEIFLIFLEKLGVTLISPDLYDSTFLWKI